MITIRYVTNEDKRFWFELDKHLPEAEFEKKVRDRQAAALKLWKLVRRCVQLASPTLKLRMVYSHEWLIKYRSELEEFR